MFIALGHPAHAQRRPSTKGRLYPKDWTEDVEMEEGVNGGISGAEGGTDFQALYAMAAQNAKVSTILGRLKEGTEGTIVLVGR